mmetsp:Transcript_80823/g.99011  ORF Transcript_80823/g.99011 Transcript_80823/m.99011 type:complete len:212 (-) Transcript_80823:69-704(-)
MTSKIPGTTLDIIPYLVHGYKNTRILDTPGVIDMDNIHLKLNIDELKDLIPKKKVIPITYQLDPGKCIILGTLARLDFIKGDHQFYFTSFAANTCSIHVTSIDKAEHVISKNGGILLRPLNDIDRLNDENMQMEFKKTYNLVGIGWQHAVCDVVFPGIGWISIVGYGEFDINVYGIKGMKVGVRKPLLPREHWSTLKKYHGPYRFRLPGRY